MRALLPLHKSTESTISPFNLPQYVIEPARVSGVLDLVRARVNKGYMPSSFGKVEFNSKPEYVSRAIPEFPLWPNPDYNGCSGYFAFDHGDTYCTGWDPVLKQPIKDIFAYIKTPSVDILINLQTCATLVRLSDQMPSYCQDKSWREWPDDLAFTTSIDPVILSENIDIYL